MRLQALLAEGRARLNASSPSARLDAELLLSHVLNKPSSFLLTWPEHEIPPAEVDAFRALIDDRVAGQPVAYLLGEREFWGLPFEVNPHTLIPRPDTETLVEAVLSLYPADQPCVFLDLGTGSGALACAVKSERPAFDVHATDCHAKTLETAKRNAKRLQLPIHFHLGYWFEAILNQRFDCIVSNPPYIDPIDPHLTQGDVRFEPQRALTAEDSGMADLRHLITLAPEYLNREGWLLLEHGYNQHEAVQSAMIHRGFQHVKTILDYGHQPRVTLGQWL